ncbi:hypothetical protein IAR55_004894 [Kwoniella newhampshirensis]|uniref:Uncharacterized protein n=1 Tax=Kwoniella newhampshirensis TaxID=1651941 RepID=A0AAW0YN66_9TREE
MSSPASGSSSLRSRSNIPPPVQTHRSSNPSTTGDHDDDDQPKSSAGSTSIHFPGGLPLPAVKGTIGGIDSPRRHVRGSTSISTLRGEPSTPGSGSLTPQPQNSEKENDQEVNNQNQPPPSAPPPSAKAVFRADPTVKSCLLELKMDKKDEIARLFGVA